MMFNDLDPANNFTMGGLPMAMVQALLLEGKPLPTMLFLDVMVENPKTDTPYQKPPFGPLPNSKHWC